MSVVFAQAPRTRRAYTPRTSSKLFIAFALVWVCLPAASACRSHKCSTWVERVQAQPAQHLLPKHPRRGNGTSRGLLRLSAQAKGLSPLLCLGLDPARL